MANYKENKFMFEDNQLMWDVFFNNKLEEWDNMNREILENTVWTDEEKIREARKLSGYNIPIEKITPYYIKFIKKKQSLQQYKPIILEFEKFIQKSFNDIKIKDIEEFSQITKKQNKLNHLNGYLLHCVCDGTLKTKDEEFLMSLLPNVYRKLVQIIKECK